MLKKWKDLKKKKKAKSDRRRHRRHRNDVVLLTRGRNSGAAAVHTLSPLNRNEFNLFHVFYVFLLSWRIQFLSRFQWWYGAPSDTLLNNSFRRFDRIAFL